MKASAVASLGHTLQAVALYEEAIAIRERLVNMDGQAHLAEALYRLMIQRECLLTAAGAEIRGDKQQ